MNIAFMHFSDIQRAALNEMARDWLELENYVVLPKFKYDTDKIWAENLLAKVTGAPRSVTLERQSSQTPDILPIQQVFLG